MTSLIDTAIKIGEEAVDRSIAMANRERRLKWWLYRIKFLLKTGRTQSAMNMADEALEFVKENQPMVDMANRRPPVNWVHALHQVTGLFAIRGNRVTNEERARVQEILKGVLVEMEDDQNWIQLQAGRRPRPADSDPFV
jgi:hypothetical protein